MSVSKWAYTPDKCDGDYCPGACDICDKPWEDAWRDVVKGDRHESDVKEFHVADEDAGEKTGNWRMPICAGD